MTSMAFNLGCVPMATASGAGANSLHAIGTGVIGGMLASTLISSFFVPMFFVILESVTGGDKHQSETDEAAPETAPVPATGDSGGEGH
jgi:multidrug efflux pump